MGGPREISSVVRYDWNFTRPQRSAFKTSTFTATNKSQPQINFMTRTIDVHFLLVQEAIEETMRALEQVLLSGEAKLDVIVGKGLHSRGGTAKIKPEVIKFATG